MCTGRSEGCARGFSGAVLFSEIALGSLESVCWRALLFFEGGFLGKCSKLYYAFSENRKPPLLKGHLALSQIVLVPCNLHCLALGRPSGVTGPLRCAKGLAVQAGRVSWSLYELASLPLVAISPLSFCN